MTLRTDFTDDTAMEGVHAAHHNALAMAVNGYKHDQPTPAATWVVHHGLGGTPTALLVQDASGVLHTEMVPIDSDTVHLLFSVPTAGTAQLRL